MVKSSPVLGDSQCKGPKVKAYLKYLRNKEIEGYSNRIRTKENREDAREMLYDHFLSDFVGDFNLF